MKHFLIYLLFLLLPHLLFAQDSLGLKAFYNADSSFVGYKDLNGKVIIPDTIDARFGVPDKFKNIISVIESNDQDEFQFYFLTNSGKKVGQDSLYFFDNAPDCENEGFIRFFDKKSGNMGLLNAKGEVQIPAIYSQVDRVKNGMIAVLKDAVLTKDHPDDEYSYWVGGKSSLIDTNNQVIIENFPMNDNLNLYLPSKNGYYAENEVWEKFTGKDGNSYAFVNYEKDFEKTLQDQFSFQIRDELIAELCYDSVAVWSKESEWKFQKGIDFIAENSEKLELIFESVVNKKADYSISKSNLNPYIFQGADFGQYFDQCGNSMYWKYPTFDLVINHKDSKQFSQTHLEFLYTEDGIRLIQASFAN